MRFATGARHFPFLLGVQTDSVAHTATLFQRVSGTLSPGVQVAEALRWPFFYIEHYGWV
jgi:hypothetical protein